MPPSYDEEEDYTSDLVAISPVTEDFFSLELTQGKKVKWRTGVSYADVPGEEEVCVVCRVLPLIGNTTFLQNPMAPVLNPDFTILFKSEDGDLVEYPYDSRYFELVD